MNQPDLTFYDVIIAGGGPGGSAAAYFLGLAGWKVLVLEKQTLPRYKACGGGIALPFLEETFPNISFEPVIERRVSSLQFHYLGMKVNVPCKENILTFVMRDRFDEYLLSQARCEVHQGEAVRHVHENQDEVWVETSQGNSYHARYLIGADGATSVVRRESGLAYRRKVAGAIEVEVPVPEPILQRYANGPVFIFSGPRFGYMWIFPKGDHLSVGVAAIGVNGSNLKKSLVKKMNSLGINLGDAPLHGHPIPLYSRKAALITRRVLLVGDAAGLIDPFSGEGIRPAIKSGQLAAIALLNGQPENYPRLVWENLGLDHAISWWVISFFFALKELCLVFGAPNPYTTQAILDLVAGRGSSIEVFGWSLVTLPFHWMLGGTADLLHVFAGRKMANRFRSTVYPGRYSDE